MNPLIASIVTGLRQGKLGKLAAAQQLEAAAIILPSATILSAVEFGYKAAEKGMNLQAALAAAKELLQ